MDLIEINYENQPPKAELNQIRPGLFCLLALDSGENFWARCVEKNIESKSFRGVVEHIPGGSASIEVGEEVVFNKRHVWDLV